MKKTPLKKRRSRENWTNEDWRKESVEWAKKIAKHLAHYICVKSGKSSEQGYQMHGSHILPEGKYHRMSVVVDNIMDQCARCHLSWHENPLAQHKWFNEKFPGRYKKLLEMDKEFSKSIIKPDYHAIHDELKEQYNKLIN